MRTRKRVRWLLFSLVVITPLLLQHQAGTCLAAVHPVSDPVPAGIEFSWPARGEITRTWTLDRHSDRGHRGIDIALAAGGPVKAAAGGKVVFAGYTPAEGGGLTVVIEHVGGIRSSYLHLREASVERGQVVDGGDEIGTGDGRPLHFGIKSVSGHRRYLNPLDLLPAAGYEEGTSTAAGGTPAPGDGPEEKEVAAAPGPGAGPDIPDAAAVAPDAAPAAPADFAAAPATPKAAAAPSPAVPETVPAANHAENHGSAGARADDRPAVPQSKPPPIVTDWRLPAPDGQPLSTGRVRARATAPAAARGEGMKTTLPAALLLAVSGGAVIAGRGDRRRHGGGKRHEPCWSTSSIQGLELAGGRCRRHQPPGPRPSHDGERKAVEETRRQHARKPTAVSPERPAVGEGGTGE